MSELEKLIDDLKLWLTEIKAEFKRLIDNEYPVILAEDIMKKYKISDDTLLKWEKKGLIGIKIGHTKVYTWKDVERFFENHKTKSE